MPDPVPNGCRCEQAHIGYWAGDPLRPRRHRHRFRQLDRGPPLRRPTGRDPREGPLRRHLPQRRVHPHEDVRLPGRPRAVRRARAGARRRDPAAVQPTGRRSGTGSSGGSTRSRTPARSTAGGCPNVDVYDGTCRFTGPRTIDTGTGVEITADEVVIAAGTRPWIPDIPGLDTVTHHTSDTVMRIDALPERVGIVGGGFIGAEFAHVFSSFGAHVTQIHRGDVLLGKEDADVAARFTALAGRQWEVLLGTTVDGVKPVGDGVRLELSSGETQDVDVLLFATGRTPQLRPARPRRGRGRRGRGRLRGRRRVPAHHRAGGLGARRRLQPAPAQAPRQPGRPDRAAQPAPPRTTWQVSDHRFVPSAVFSSPQIAKVGLTEQEARDRGIDTLPSPRTTTATSPTAGRWRTADQFAKLLADRATGALLGAHLIGPQASILIQPLVQAMSFGQPVGETGPRPVLDPPGAGGGRGKRAPETGGRTELSGLLLGGLRPPGRGNHAGHVVVRPCWGTAS